MLVCLIVPLTGLLIGPFGNLLAGIGAPVFCVGATCFVILSRYGVSDISLNLIIF